MAKKILLIDDDQDIVDIVQEALDYEGFAVVATADSRDVPSLIKIHQPDLLLIDYLLHGINGGEICAQLKKATDTAGLPIIIMSAYPRVLQSLGSYQSDAFIAKPFDLEYLTRTINLHIAAAATYDAQRQC